MDIPFNYKQYCKDINYASFRRSFESGYVIGVPFVDLVEEKIQEITRYIALLLVMLLMQWK